MKTHRPHRPEASREESGGPRVVRRRDFLLGGAGILVGVGSALAAPRIGSLASTFGFAGDTATASTATSDTTRRYVSSQATLPSFTVWKKPGATLAPGLLFAGIVASKHQGAIFDDDGEPVWIEPNGLDVMDLRVQQYRGKRVLTYWSGEIIDGYGHGTGTILDTSYQVVATVHASSGQTVDAHEFRLTDADTALITTYPTEPADLTPIGGPEEGWILNCRIQEVDVATGAILLDWKAADHIGLDESYETLGSTGTAAATPYDAFHVNSIDVDTDGDGSGRLLVSARHTHTVYSLDRSSGTVRWRLGGKKSDYTLDADAVFAWQHDVRRISPTAITVFDNHVKTSKGTSRGLRLAVDDTAKTVSLDSDYLYGSTNAYAMGNMQTLDDGHVVVGWGMGHRVTEFGADGTPLLDVDFGTPSYRTFRNEWTATPTEKPAVASAVRADGTVDAYATWNGATEVASWRFDTGSSVTRLTPAITVPRSGFESTASLPASTWVQAVALNAHGATLAKSAIARM